VRIGKAIAYCAFCITLVSINTSFGAIFEHPATILTYDEDERIFRPVDVAWDEGGLCYLLCAGSCKVLVLDEEFNVIREFGSCGESPGEIGQGKTLEIIGDRLFIFQGNRLDIFRTDGEFLKRVIIPREIHDTEVSDLVILGTTKDGDKMISVFDTDGRITGEIGPACMGDTWNEKYESCGTLLVFEDDGQILILDLVSALLNRQIGGEWKESFLGINTGKIWNEGGAVYKQAAVYSSCGIPGDDLALILYQESADKDKRSLGIVNREYHVERIKEIDAVPYIQRLKFSPRGELWALYCKTDIKVFPNQLLKALRMPSPATSRQ
jgi:hypothetical protein